MAVALLLLAPGGATPAPPWLQRFVAAGGDALIHGALFLVQSALVERAWRRSRPGGARIWLAAALALAYGLLLEGAQELVPGRGWEWTDLLADAAGAASWALYRAWRRA